MLQLYLECPLSYLYNIYAFVQFEFCVAFNCLCACEFSVQGID